MCRDSINPQIHFFKEKTAGLLAQTGGNQTQFRRTSAYANRIPADLKEDWAPSLDAEGAR